MVEGSGFRGSWIGCGKLRCCGLAKSGVYLLPRRGLVGWFDCKSSLCWSLLQTCAVFLNGERGWECRSRRAFHVIGALE